MENSRSDFYRGAESQVKFHATARIPILQTLTGMPSSFELSRSVLVPKVVGPLCVQGAVFYYKARDGGELQEVLGFAFRHF